MNLTYRGFLRGYCRELTGLDTDSMRKLSAAVASDAPHAAEALFLFACEQGRLDLLLEASSGAWMEPLYRESASRLASLGAVEGFLDDAATPERFRKVRDAYLAKARGAEADRRVIALMRERTLAAIRESGVTVYRLCADLGLNQGNVYAYLNKGDLAKVSRATARRLMARAEGPAGS